MRGRRQGKPQLLFPVRKDVRSSQVQSRLLRSRAATPTAPGTTKAAPSILLYKTAASRGMEIPARTPNGSNAMFGTIFFLRRDGNEQSHLIIRLIDI